MSTLGNTEAPLTGASQAEHDKAYETLAANDERLRQYSAAPCPTCQDTGQVWTAEPDGSGAYDQACPHCDTPYPRPAPTTGEDPF